MTFCHEVSKPIMGGMIHEDTTSFKTVQKRLSCVNSFTANTYDNTIGGRHETASSD